MIRYLILSFLIFAFQPLFVPDASAGSWYLGAGLSQVNFGIDLENWRSIKVATAPEVVVGYQSSPTLVWEAMFTHSTHDEQGLPGDLTYSKAELGPRFIFASDSTLRHSLGLGLGYHALDSGKGLATDDGPGIYFDAGVEEYSGRRHSLRLRMRWSYWITETDLEMLTTTLGLMYNYHFGK